MTQRTQDYGYSHLTGGLAFTQLYHANKDRNETKFLQCKEWTESDWSNALAGETGEFCNLVKKVRRGDTVEVRKLADELADVVLYADLCAQKLGIDLGLAVARKFNEVSRRVGSPIRLSHNAPRME